MIKRSLTPMDYNGYKGQIYTADFETSTDKWNVDKARVWLWDICKIKSYNHITGTDIKEFFKALYKLSIKGYKSIIVAFHNLAYDGAYVLTWLLENGYKAVATNTPSSYEFYTLITSYGQHYQYIINMGRGLAHQNNFYVVIVDSYKTIHKSVRDIANAYGLPILKGEIDYDRYREEGYSPNQTEVAYIHNDTEIMARALDIQFEQGFTKVTQPANALHHYKKLIGNKTYEALFPRDDNFDFIRKSYFGGMCYANPKFVGIELHNLHSYDINSMYPACMLHYYLPYGYALYAKGNVCKGLKENQLAVQRIRCSYELKPNCIPSLFKNRFSLSTEKHSTTSKNFIVELVLTNLDIELLFDNYYVADVEWIDGYIYNAVKGYELSDEEFKTLSYNEIIERDGKGSLFYDYIKEFRVIKENSMGAMRDIAKFMQNMLYGNFGKNIDGKIRVPYLKEDGTLGYVIEDTGEVRSEYIPMATFITSQCRYHLIMDIKANIENFVYCDTDSMYLLDSDNPVDLRISDNLYGAYKIEKEIKRMKVLGSKRYILEGKDLSKNKEGIFVSCCGAPKEVKENMNFDNFQYEAEFDGKRQVKSVPGGKHIVSTTYKIKKEKE